MRQKSAGRSIENRSNRAESGTETPWRASSSHMKAGIFARAKR
jgi:hypothetical protein